MNENVDILSIIIDGSKSLDPMLLCTLGSVSKAHKERCDYRWKNITLDDVRFIHHYADNCCVCREKRISLNKIGICRFCMISNDTIDDHVVTPFEFKHEWNMNPVVLLGLPKISRYNRLFRKEEELYSRRDIINMLLVYLNGPKNLTEYYEFKSSQRERFNKLFTMLSLTPKNIDMVLKDHILYDYVKKRHGTLKAIENYISVVNKEN